MPRDPAGRRPAGGGCSRAPPRAPPLPPPRPPFRASPPPCGQRRPPAPSTCCPGARLPTACCHFPALPQRQEAISVHSRPLQSGTESNGPRTNSGSPHAPPSPAGGRRARSGGRPPLAGPSRAGGAAALPRSPLPRCPQAPPAEGPWLPGGPWSYRLRPASSAPAAGTGGWCRGAEGRRGARHSRGAGESPEAARPLSPEPRSPRVGRGRGGGVENGGSCSGPRGKAPLARGGYRAGAPCRF